MTFKDVTRWVAIGGLILRSCNHFVENYKIKQRTSIA